jgi:hypothetical protein
VEKYVTNLAPVHWIFKPLHLTTLRMLNMFAIQALNRKLWKVVILLLYSHCFLRKEWWELYDRIAANDNKNELTGIIF